MKCIIGNKKWLYGFRDELKVTKYYTLRDSFFTIDIIY